MINKKTMLLIQLLGTTLQVAAPDIVDSETARTIYSGVVALGQAIAGFAALWNNPDGSSAKEPYVKYRRKNG